MARAGREDREARRRIDRAALEVADIVKACRVRGRARTGGGFAGRTGEIGEEGFSAAGGHLDIRR